MKLIKQKKNHCWLAALCMADGQDYEKYKNRYNHSRMPAGIEIVHTQLETWFPWYKPRQWFTPKLISKQVKLNGTGVLIYGWRWRNSHAVAFKDGMIYDPKEHISVTWRVYKQALTREVGRQWVIRDIQKKPGG